MHHEYFTKVDVNMVQICTAQGLWTPGSAAFTP